MNEHEALGRLDSLIGKSRADMYKPIAVAEILYRIRNESAGIDLQNLDSYRRPSYRWMQEIILRLHDKTTQLNSRYWDQLFDHSHISSDALRELIRINANDATIERYIYSILNHKFKLIADEIRSLGDCSPIDFCLDKFLSNFLSNDEMRRSVDRVYEAVVYALFETIVRATGATVTVSVNETAKSIVAAFEDFVELLLGITPEQLSATIPAHLYRLGTANQADAGLDIWANFGPAVQVKHMDINSKNAGKIADNTRAERLLIVCRSTADKAATEHVLNAVGTSSRIVKLIIQDDLNRWYKTACVDSPASGMGKNLLLALQRELIREFALTTSIDAFLDERGYNIDTVYELLVQSGLNPEHSCNS